MNMNKFSTNLCEPWVLMRGLCRCCHAEGSFQSLGVPNNDFGESVVLSNMLDFIGIRIEPRQGYFGRATFKICSACITQLRAAYNFKEQVISCENSFQLLCEKNLIKVSGKKEVKSEKFESDDEDGPETPPDDEIKREIKIEYTKEATSTDTTMKPQTRRQVFILASEPKIPVVKAETKTETENSDKEIDDEDIKGENNEQTCPKRLKKVVKKETVKKSVTKPRKMAVKSETRAENRKEKSPKKAGRSPKRLGSWLKDILEVNGIFRCAKCDKIQGKREEIRRHLISKHYMYACTKCSEKFNTRFERDKHMFEVHDVLYKSRKSNPVLYIGSWTRAVIEKNGLYGCNANAFADNKRAAASCDHVQHKNKEVILHHLANFHYKLICTECPERFRSKPGLHRHLLTEHNIDKSIIINCGSCEKVFYSEKKYAIHLKIYHKLGVLRKCDKCDYESYCLRTLKRHRMSHTNTKPFCCSFCEKTFKRKSAKLLHERIHTREGLKQCPYCEQSFVQRSSVKYHVLKHHPGERI